MPFSGIRTAFTDRYAGAFATFPDFLNTELLGKMETVNTAQAENVHSADIFARLRAIPLIDPYEAYQLLDSRWKDIAVDLEILQTEGFSRRAALIRAWSSRRRIIRTRKYKTAGRGMSFPLNWRRLVCWRTNCKP